MVCNVIFFKLLEHTKGKLRGGLEVLKVISVMTLIVLYGSLFEMPFIWVFAFFVTAGAAISSEANLLKALMFGIVLAALCVLLPYLGVVGLELVIPLASVLFVGVLQFYFRIERAGARKLFSQWLPENNNFVDDVSHEIRTPIEAVFDYSRYVLGVISEVGVLEGKTRNQVEKDVRRLQDSASILLGVLDGVLDLSKLDAEMISLEFEKLQVMDIIEDLIPIMEAMASKNDNSLEIKSDPLLGDWILDERAFKQVILNLVENASKFTKNGNIEINLFLSEGDSLVLRVIDSGAGIAPEMLPMIFERYFESGYPDAGRGLGLAISKKLAALMSGNISVLSELGSGSIFTVTLPGGESLGKKRAA